MPERRDGGIIGIDGPRPLDADFRARLENALLAESGVAVAASGRASRWTIDRPRRMPSGARARIEATLVGRRAPSRSLMVRMTAAIAALLVASTVILVTGRVRAPVGPGTPGPVLALPGPKPRIPAAPKQVTPHGPSTLKGFSSATAFLRYVRGQAAALVGPYGLQQVTLYAPGSGGMVTPVPAMGGSVAGTGSGGSAAAPIPAMAPPQAAYSTTNVQEEGVDEPDIVKTDGRRLVFVTYTKLQVLDVTHSVPRALAALPLQYGVGAFLAGDRVIVVSSLFGAPPGAARAVHVADRPWTRVTVVDIATPTRPAITSSMEIEGAYVGARMVGGIVRLVIRSGALGPQSVPIPTGGQASLDAARIGNLRAIRGSSVGDWVPHYVVERPGRPAVTGHVLDWRNISRPPDPAGLGMLTLLTIDPADPRPNNAVSVVGSGDIVYSSIDNLYVTSNSLNDVLSLQSGRPPKAPVTRIHAFDIRDPKRARYVGSGAVPGYLLNQFSLSELDGYLRVASTLGLTWIQTDSSATSRNRVTVLALRSGQLIQVGAVGNIGRGERIFSVRFVGHMGYVVTFRQLDPLFVIDLRKPSQPRVAGRLTVPGYSGYLHPISDTLLLGVGRSADAAGRTLGVQLSLFDVSNPTAPRRLDATSIGADGYSPVEYDHHAFLYWRPRHLAVVPLNLYDGGGSVPFTGALAITATGSGFGTQLRITHAGRPDPGNVDLSIQRVIVLGDELVTISEAGVLTSDLTTLDARGWVPFGS